MRKAVISQSSVSCSSRMVGMTFWAACESPTTTALRAVSETEGSRLHEEFSLSMSAARSSAHLTPARVAHSVVTDSGPGTGGFVQSLAWPLSTASAPG